MADLVEVWKSSLPAVLNNVTGRGVWAALNAAVPIVIDDGVLVLGIPQNDTELAGHLRLPNTSRNIEVAFSQKFGSPVKVRVIGGTTTDDYEIVKRRDGERRRMQEAEMVKLRKELTAKSSWEGVYEQLSRRFSAITNRSLPQNKARFYVEALELVAEARKEHQETDDMSERNFARCLERIAVFGCAKYSRRGGSPEARGRTLGVGTAVILGSGTSNGIPMLGTEYPKGYFDDPRNRRNRACLALKGPSGNLIVDCPPELRIMAHAAGIHDIEAVLITHTHADHVMGMDDLRSICMKTGLAVPVYTLPRYQEDIRRIFVYAFQEFPKGVFVPRFDLHDVPETPSNFEVGGMSIRTFLVEHGKVPVIGLRVGDCAYVTDVSRIPDEAMAELRGLDTFVVDAVRYRPHPNHFHYDLALQTAEMIGARRTILTHLSGDYDHAKTSRDLPQGVELAYDGLVVDF